MLPALAAIEAQVQDSPWSLDALRDELSRPLSRIWTACFLERPLEPVGFICFRIVADEIYIMEFSVSKAFQGMGIGGGMLDLVIRFGCRKGIRRIVLDADPANRAAIGLYISRGFSFQRSRVQPGIKSVMSLALMDAAG